MWLFFCLSVCIVLYCKSEEDYDYQLVKADNRNIIFVGKGRSGKSTLIEVLKNKDYDPGQMTILRGTQDASVASFTVRSNFNNYNLHFNIMDTPGLFEHTMDKNDERSNQIILDAIKKCIDLEITKINHVYFVMTIQSGLNMQDVKAFEVFAELFVGMEDKISIILSFSQTTTERQYPHFILQFREVPALKTLYDKIGDRIFFLGAVEQSDIYDTDKLKANVYRQRNRLFKHIINQTEAYNVKQLKVYKDNIKFLQTIQETLDECCRSMKTCVDSTKFDNFIKHYTPNIDYIETKSDDDDNDGAAQ